MTAYDFVTKVITTFEYDANEVFKMAHNSNKDDDGYELVQWIDINKCIVKTGQVVLGLSPESDAPAECINTLATLKKFFLEHNIRMADKMFVNAGNGVYPINDIKGYANIDGDLYIKCL